MTVAVPDWLRAMDPGRIETIHARTRYLIRSAGLLHSQQGYIAELALGLGVSPELLAKHCGNPRNAHLITPETAVKIERLVGRHNITREMLRPDLFA